MAGDSKFNEDEMKKFLVQLLAIQLLVFVLIAITYVQHWPWYHFLSVPCAIFFFLVSLITGWVGWKGMQKDPESAVNYLLSAIGLHFMACLIGVAIAIILLTGYDLLFVGWFFSYYILYTCFVVWSLMTTLRPHLRPSNSTDK